jgi:formate/nitrite transporter FocA (FNT family)
MYYLFTAYFGGAEISLLEILYNLSVSALGNFVGGGIVVAGTNYIIGQQS